MRHILAGRSQGQARRFDSVEGPESVDLVPEPTPRAHGLGVPLSHPIQRRISSQNGKPLTPARRIDQPF
jgi:hypothetical protein